MGWAVRKASALLRSQIDHANALLSLEGAIGRFGGAKKAMRLAICHSKSRCWDELVKSVDRDPWGKPYKLVLGKLNGQPPVTTMEKAMLMRVTSGLFPSTSTNRWAVVKVLEAIVV